MISFLIRCAAILTAIFAFAQPYEGQGMMIPLRLVMLGAAAVIIYAEDRAHRRKNREI